MTHRTNARDEILQSIPDASTQRLLGVLRLTLNCLVQRGATGEELLDACANILAVANAEQHNPVYWN